MLFFGEDDTYGVETLPYARQSAYTRAIVKTLLKTLIFHGLL